MAGLMPTQGGMPPGPGPEQPMPPEGGAAPPMQGEQPASPEDTATYQEFLGNVMNVVYDEKVASGIAPSFQGPSRWNRWRCS